MDNSDRRVPSNLNTINLSSKVNQINPYSTSTRSCRCLKSSNIQPVLNNLAESVTEKDNVRNEKKVISNILSENTDNLKKQMSDINTLSISGLKSLNNQKTINLNKEEISQLSQVSMLLKPPRSKKRILIFCSILVFIFTAASSLPFLVESLRSSSITSVSFIPIHNVYQIFKTDARDSSSWRDDLLRQVFISVKTTSRFHNPRLVILLETWMSLARESTWVFTDQGELGGRLGELGEHLVQTNCSNTHHR